VKTTLRSTIAAAMLLAPIAATFIAAPAYAQRAAQPQISNLNLNSDAGLLPGATLRVQVNASPDARRASVTLGDSGVTVPLHQRSAGSYDGSYVVRRGDHIDPMQLMTARLQFGDHATTRQFNYPPAFQALAMGAAPAPQNALIERFVMRPAGRMEPGSELRFRLVGAPGGDAWLDIPGVIRGVDLAETRPGVYEGTYVIRRRDNPDAFRNAVATLRSGNQHATARVDLRSDEREWMGRDDRRDRDGRDERMGRDEHGPRDVRGPQITDLMPANGDRITDRAHLRVGARLSDVGSGIDPRSVQLHLNGRDVTAEARVTPDEVTYRGDLAPGRYTAEVAARDQAGNVTTKRWTFDVMPGDHYGAGPANGYAAPAGLPLQITSPGNNMAVDANGNVAIQGRTVPYANVHVHVESVASVAGLIGVTQPVADLSVQADRNGFFAADVPPRPGIPLPGTRFEVRVTATSGSQTGEEHLTLVQRQG
jgi:hypothetical protein